MDGRIGSRVPHLPTVLAATAALMVVGVGIAAVTAGAAAAAGMAAGVGVVAASYLFSTVAIAWADSVHPRMVLPVGLTAYAVKFTLIGFGMMALTEARWAGLYGLGFGVVAGVLVWTSSQVWWVVKGKYPHLDPPADTVPADAVPADAVPEQP